MSDKEEHFNDAHVLQIGADDYCSVSDTSTLAYVFGTALEVHEARQVRAWLDEVLP